MRSRTFVKRTVPCLSVIFALFMQSSFAHAEGLTLGQKNPTGTITAGAGQVSQAPSQEAPVDLHGPQLPLAEKNWLGLQAAQAKVNASWANANTTDSDLTKLRNSIGFEIVRSSAINNEHHTKLSAYYTDQKLMLRLAVDETALKQPELLIKDFAMAMAVTHALYPVTEPVKNYRRVLESPHSWAETYFNAMEGGIISKSRLASIEAATIRSDIMTNVVIALNQNNIEVPNSAAQIEADRQQTAKIDADLAAQATKYARQQQKALDQWRSQTQALDKYEAMTDKLNDLMLKNDRKGVRAMLEAYLPWQVMEPTEYKIWKNWLDAIENPDLNNTTVAFRGLDYKTDKIQRTQTSKGEKFAFMSTVLTKNQGSYTRRLRSLTTNREKNGDEGYEAFGEKLMDVKITDQMTAHARDPKASSFLSFTYNPYIAARFIGRDKTVTENGKTTYTPAGGLLAVRIDSRRMIPNVVSMFAAEIELLAPLIIFPDEVIDYHEGDFHGSNGGTDNNLFKEYVTEISQKSGKDFSTWMNTNSDAQMMTTFKKDGIGFLKQISEQSVNAPFCSKIF